MKSFKDSTGQAWDIAVNLQTRAIVSARTGIDLLLIGNGDQHTMELLQSPSHSFDVLVALCDSQLKQRVLTVEDFGALLNSEEVVNDAITAIVEATFDFFRNPQVQILRKTMMTVLKIQQEERTKAQQALEATMNDPDFEAKIRASLRNPNATGSPESSASTPAASPGDS